MLDDFNFIIHKIKQEWLPRHNIFGICETLWTFLAGCVFPLVWSVAPNYCIEICQHQCDCFILAFGLFQQIFLAEFAMAGLIEKLWCSFFAQFLYFSIQRWLFSVGFYESGFIDSFWSSVIVIPLHLFIWTVTQCIGNGWIRSFFNRSFYIRIRIFCSFRYWIFITRFCTRSRSFFCCFRRSISSCCFSGSTLLFISI